MLSIEEILGKTEAQRKRIETCLDGFGFYHPNVNIKNEGTASLTDGLSRADAWAVTESMRAIPLREFLAKSGTTGLMGAAYLVPVKAQDLAVFYSLQSDRVPLLSAQVLQDWQGDQWKVSVADDESYVPKTFSSGGRMAEEEAAFTQVTLDLSPVHHFGLNINVGNDLLEDVTDYDLLEWHLKQAAVAMGRLATDRLMEVLVVCTDGVGTLNAQAGGADTTTYANVMDGATLVGDDRFVVNTMVITPEAWGDEVGVTAAGLPGLTTKPPDATGFDMKMQTMDVVFSTAPALHAAGDLSGAAFTDCKTMVFDRLNALLSGRKRWLRLERYADPVRDLAGAVIVGEQDTVSLYDDAVCRILET